MDPADGERKPPGGARARRPCRRRLTCPTPPEIGRAMASAGLGELPQACSLDQLLERCLDAFELDGRLQRGEYTVDMTLTVHGWVVPSAELARRLLALYQEATRDGREERALRVCLFVRHWATHYPEDFRLEPALAEALGELRGAALHGGRGGHGGHDGRWHREGHGDLEGHGDHARLLDAGHVPCGRAGRLSPPRARAPGPPKRKVSLLFDHLEAGELARHLSGLEHRAFCRLSCQDCRRYVQRGGAQGTPALERAVALCNGVCRWVQLMVLSRPTAPQRAEVVAKLTRITQELRELQNFNTLMAVVGGLCHSSISRLKDTQALLPPEVAKALGAMAELVSARGNFGAYRRAFGACRGFRLPLLAVHLKDLAALDAALPAHLPGGRLNLPKLHGLYQHALDLRALQRLAPPFRADPQLLRLLALSLDTSHTEEELYELSHAREPHGPKVLPPLPDKTPRDGEWEPPGTPRAEPPQPDPPETPETEPAEQDGDLSHDFHEATFKKPTFCQVCNSFLWGVSKQGCHSQGCGTECQGLAEAQSRTPPPGRPPRPGSEEEEEEEGEEGPGGPCRDAWTQTEPGTPLAPPGLLEQLERLREERDRLLQENRRLRPPAPPPPPPPLGALGGLRLRDPPPPRGTRP